MTSRHSTPPPQASKLVVIGLLLALAALIFSFFAQPLAFLLLVVAVIIGIVVISDVSPQHSRGVRQAGARRRSPSMRSIRSVAPPRATDTTHAAS
jgi:hypothetical protein